jgi:ribosomal protein L22
MAYAYQDKEGKRTARARITGANASYKDLCEVCSNVRTKDTEFALEFLGKAAEGKQAILMAQHGKRRGHRRELGGKRGGFPKKSAKIVLGVLEGANANAIKLGLGPTRIAHIMANKQHTYPRMSPKGRRIVHNYETAIVEIVLEEFQKQSGKKSEAKKAEAKPVEKKAEVVKTEAEQKRSEMSSSDTKRPLESMKIDTVRKEVPRI